jgi:hypothetical protein
MGAVAGGLVLDDGALRGVEVEVEDGDAAGGDGGGEEGAISSDSLFPPQYSPIVLKRFYNPSCVKCAISCLPDSLGHSG